MAFKAYPLTVAPILKEKVWGGKNLSAYVDTKNRKIGEAWMLADQNENKSIINSGALKGMAIGKAIEKYPDQMMGPKLLKKYGKRFPLLFKFLDTNDRISIQVHPDDNYARQRGFAAGKTEMWYVLGNKFRSSLLVGFKSKESRKTLYEAITKGSLASKLKKYRPSKSDCFFIPAGTIHTIGKGNVIFEIQQNSDITYRIYDWGRQNLKEDRPLNITDALNSVKFDSNGGMVRSKETAVSGGIKSRSLARCGYFDSDELTFEKNSSYWYNDNKVMVLTVIDGSIQITDKKGEHCRYGRGILVFIPYSLTELLITAVKNTRLIITEAK